MKIGLSRVIPVAVLVMTMIGAVVAFTSFTQHVPSVSVPAASAQISTVCSTLNQDTVATPPTPNSGTLAFNCGSPGPAFTVSGTGAATPTFNLAGTGYTSLAISTNADCSSTPTPAFTATLTSGKAVIFTVTGGIDYCATYSGISNTGGTLGTFDVTWS